MSRRKAFSKSLDQGHLGRGEGSEGHSPALSLAPTLKPGAGRLQRGQGSCLTNSHSSLLPAPLPQDWRTGSGLRTWLLSPRRYPGALSTRYRACRWPGSNWRQRSRPPSPWEGPPLATCTWPANRTTNGGTLGATASRRSALLGGHCPRTAPWREPSAGQGGWWDIREALGEVDGAKGYVLLGAQVPHLPWVCVHIHNHTFSHTCIPTATILGCSNWSLLGEWMNEKIDTESNVKKRLRHQ